MPGLSVNAAAGKRLFGNLDDIKRESNSELPHVRSDFASYLKEGDPGIQQLTVDYVTKLDDDLYGRASVGLLEWMFGGVSGELLWQPANQNWGLGAEINWVQQRDFDQLFGFRDYDVVTGHASLYWDTGWHGISTQIDAGRYLAGDWGGTFKLKRRFPNGWCKKVSPVLNENDIHRLSLNLGISVEQFQDQYLRKDEDEKYVLKKLPCPFL